METWKCQAELRFLTLMPEYFPLEKVPLPVSSSKAMMEATPSKLSRNNAFFYKAGCAGSYIWSTVRLIFQPSLPLPTPSLYIRISLGLWFLPNVLVITGSHLYEWMILGWQNVLVSAQTISINLQGWPAVSNISPMHYLFSTSSPHNIGLTETCLWSLDSDFEEVRRHCFSCFIWLHAFISWHMGSSCSLIQNKESFYKKSIGDTVRSQVTRHW